MSDMHDDEVVRAITAANYVQAHIWEQALRDAGVRCRVVGDELAASVGGLPGVPAEIWVHQEDLERAKQILEEVAAAPEEYESEDEAARAEDRAGGQET
jgi:hypothetical protein